MRNFSNLGIKERGVSLLEVMLSLAIIAIVLVMATRYFGIASNTSKQNEATSQISEIQQGVYRYVNDQQGTYPASLKQLGDDDYITQNTAKGSNPWGGGLAIDGGAPPNITMSGLSATACENLANRFASIGGSCSGGTLTVPSVTNQ